jgi:hypothetical protein
MTAVFVGPYDRTTSSRKILSSKLISAIVVSAMTAGFSQYFTDDLLKHGNTGLRADQPPPSIHWDVDTVQSNVLAFPVSHSQPTRLPRQSSTSSRTLD